MPIIAKLSREFYERLGEDVVNELVELLNHVDERSRLDLKEIIEASEARVSARIDRLEAKLDQALEHMTTKESLALLESRVDKTLLAQTRWMLIAWVTIMAAILTQRF